MRTPLATTLRSRSRGLIGRPRSGGFTLAELLAVMVIVLLLSALVVGMAGYAQRKAKVSNARGDLAVIEGAIEAYNADVGRYPTSTAVRVSFLGVFEAWNSVLLAAQLAGGGYVMDSLPFVRFLSVGTNTLSTPGSLSIYSCEVTEFSNARAFVDPWESPYNYFCTYPRQPTVGLASYGKPYYPCFYGSDQITGGQRNLATFDLWSYGPDRLTCMSALNVNGSGSNAFPHIECSGYSAGKDGDDIANYQ